MPQLRVLALNGSAFDESSIASLAALAPEIVAVTQAMPSSLAAFASARGMRSASMSAPDAADESIAVLWRAEIGVGATDRFSLGLDGESAGAMRISFQYMGEPVSVLCARLSPDPAVGVGQQARLGGLIDASRGAVLAAVENVCAPAGVRWSRCDDVWLSARRRYLTLPSTVDIGLIARGAFGLTPAGPSSDERSAAGPSWYSSTELAVFESRTFASSRSGAAALRAASVALKSTLNDSAVAVAL